MDILDLLGDGGMDDNPGEFEEAVDRVRRAVAMNGGELEDVSIFVPIGTLEDVDDIDELYEMSRSGDASCSLLVTCSFERL